MSEPPVVTAVLAPAPGRRRPGAYGWRIPGAPATGMPRAEVATRLDPAVQRLVGWFLTKD